MTTTVMVAATALVLLAPAAEAGLVALLLWCQRSDARLRRQRLQAESAAASASAGLGEE